MSRKGFLSIYRGLYASTSPMSCWYFTPAINILAICSRVSAEKGSKPVPKCAINLSTTVERDTPPPARGGVRPARISLRRRSRCKTRMEETLGQGSCETRGESFRNSQRRDRFSSESGAISSVDCWLRPADPLTLWVRHRDVCRSLGHPVPPGWSL